jgi:hypothetical protein
VFAIRFIADFLDLLSKVRVVLAQEQVFPLESLEVLGHWLIS